jgi:hypothetical protein
MPSDTIELDIEGDGGDINPTPYLLVFGPADINLGTILYAPGSTMAFYLDAEAKAIENGFVMENGVDPDVPAYLAQFMLDWNLTGLTDLSNAQIVSDSTSPPPTTGTLVDSIIFHCGGPGTVLIRMVYWEEVEGVYVIKDYDTLSITQLPEPMTIGLLGLGALFLRRRK